MTTTEQEKRVKRLLSLGEHRLRLIEDATALIAHPDGKSFFTASGATIHQWSAESGEILKPFYASNEPVDAPMFLAAIEANKQIGLMWSDARKLIQIYLDPIGTLVWLNAQKGEPLLHLDISLNGKRAVLQKDSELIFWVRDAYEAQNRFSLPSQAASPCAWISLHGEGFLFATSQTLQYFEVKTEKPPEKALQYIHSLRWELPCQEIFCAAMVSEKTAVFVEQNGTVKFLSLESGEILWSRQFSTPKSKVVTNGAGLIALATEDGIRILTEEGEEKQHIALTLQSQMMLALSSRGDWVVSCQSNQELRLFMLSTGKEKFPKDGHQSEIRRLAWLGSKILSTAKDDTVVRRWNLSSSRAEWLFELAGEREVEEFFPLPDARSFFCRHQDNSAALYSSDGVAQSELPRECHLGALSLNGDLFYFVQRGEGDEEKLCWLHVWSIADSKQLKRRCYGQQLRFLAPVQGGFWILSEHGHSLLSDNFESSHPSKLPDDYVLHQVIAIEQEEALGIWSWQEREQKNPKLFYALRRWNLKTNAILWSTRFSPWKAQEKRIVAHSSKKYLVVYHSQELSFYSLKTGHLIESHGFSNEQITSVASSQHQGLLAVGYNSGAIFVYDAAALESWEEPEPPKDQGWVAEFFAAKTTEEKSEIFKRFWESLSYEWKQSFLAAYPPLWKEVSPRKLWLWSREGLFVLEAFLRDELEVRICGTTIEVEARPDYWANPEGYPDSEYVYHENNTLEPLRFLQNVISLDCSISRVTSLEPIRGLHKLKAVETKGCNILVK
jgi:WD40 repeat protein